MLLWQIILLAVGMIMLIKGADYFVDGSSKIAKALKIPSLIIGLTLVSMGTSAPELSVSINAALAGSNDLSLGNVVGSNSFNTFLILGLSSIVVPLVIGDDMKKYDIPIMLGIYGLLLLFGFVITPNKLDRIESIIFLVLFLSYMVLLFFRAKNGSEEEEVNEEGPVTFKTLILTVLIGVAGVLTILKQETIAVIVMSAFCLLLVLKFPKQIKSQSKALNIILSVFFAGTGLLAIIGGGTVVVDSASYIAESLGMSQALVGLTIVAVGTSLPELVTSVVASIKKENDIAIGNVIGSNIFNVLLILGTTSTIKPLALTSESLFDLVVLFVSGLLVFLISRFSKNMKKWQGILFVLLYVAYLAFIIIRNYA
jgi:cation:H+ antiporter